MKYSDNSEVRALRMHIRLLTLIVFVLIAFNIWQLLFEQKELTAERLNIVNPDGSPAVVISNHVRQHPGRMDGHDLPRRDRPAGIIFFNTEGDECGGLIAEGNGRGADMSFTMDQYKNDQILQLSYSQENSPGKSSRSYGFTLNDRDELPLLKQMTYFDSLKKLEDTAAFNIGAENFKKAHHIEKRLFLGKDKTGEVGLFLNDAKGRPRLRIFIDHSDKPVIEVIDEKGMINRKNI